MRKDPRLSGIVLLLLLSLPFYSAHAAETASIPIGTVLPDFKLPGPSAKADQEYLGLNSADSFAISEVSGKLVLIDFLTVM